MTQPSVDIHNCTPEQQYLIYRARSARREIERNRQKLPLRKTGWRATAEAVLVTLFWLGIAIVVWALIRQLPA